MNLKQIRKVAVISFLFYGTISACLTGLLTKKAINHHKVVTQDRAMLTTPEEQNKQGDPNTDITETISIEPSHNKQSSQDPQDEQMNILNQMVQEDVEFAASQFESERRG